MSNWNVVVPVWGERYVRVFKEVALPALVKAIKCLNQNTTLILYTDEKDWSADVSIVLRPVPGGDRSFGSLSAAHRHALSRSALGDRVSLLTADLVISEPSLLTCEVWFRQFGKKIVACAGMRVDEDYPPPDTTSGTALLEWGWKHRHPMTKECTWPDGYSFDISRMYFEKDGKVACRLLLPHPIALVRGRTQIKFGPTVDVNVVANFPMSDIHLVTEQEEVAMIELSPRDKEFLYTESMRRRFDENLPSNPSFEKLTLPRYAKFFAHQIKIVGNGGDCGDEQVVRRMLYGA